MNFLTTNYDLIVMTILIVGFAIAIGILVAMQRETAKEEQREEMASEARKVKKPPYHH